MFRALLSPSSGARDYNVDYHIGEANWFAASQEIPRISRNPKVHYRTHKRPPPGPAQSRPYTHIPPPGNPS